MSALDQQHRRGRQTRYRSDEPSGSGALGEIVNVAAAGVTVLVDEWGDEHSWGPVPYVIGGSHASPTPSPSVGNRAFLHLDSDGEPAYATVWTS